MRKTFALCSLGLLVLTGCGSLKIVRTGDAPLDYRDNLILPAGTVIKNVPFFINGKDQPPTPLDFTTDTEGAYMSKEGLRAVQGG